MTQQDTLDRRKVVARHLQDRGNLLLVTGLGSPTYDAMAAGDDELNFYLWGAMGSAAMIGFGLAMAQPDRPVLVLTGDGEMLMGLGSLVTIGIRNPRNLTIVVLDNEHYGETGMQPSHTSSEIKLDEIARASGFGMAEEIRDMEAVDVLKARIHKSDTVSFASIKINTDQAPRVLAPRDGIYVKNRFRTALGFNPL
jgi:thiamine pyrophosphate-dependent acetolactate synthase large subunit-like protein